MRLLPEFLKIEDVDVHRAVHEGMRWAEIAEAYHGDLDQIVVLTRERNALPEYQVKEALKALTMLGGEP